MDDRTAYFYAPAEVRTPYIQELLGISINPITLEGVIHFNGYYYIEDIDLPQKLRMTYRHTTGQNREVVEYLYADVEVYRREKGKATDSYSTIEDDDGEEMNVCFFPTAIQRLYFRVLEIFEDVRLPSVETTVKPEITTAAVSCSAQKNE
jgi:hypothetical protein